MSETKLLFEERASADGPVDRTSLRRGITVVLVIFLVTRLAVWVFAYGGAWIHFRIEHSLKPPEERHVSVKPYADIAHGPTSTENGRTSFSAIFDSFQPLRNSDGRHYTKIIREGYSYRPVEPTDDPRERQQPVAFFPLYPLVCQLFVPVFGVGGAMIFVAHAAGLAAAVLLYLWVRRRVDERSARFSVTALLCYPAACYYSFGYAESLTLLTLTTALWAMDARRWWLAAGICALATATRPTAAPIIGVLALAWWFNRRDLVREWRGLLLIPLGLIASLGALAYAAFLTWQFGTPLVYFENFRAGWVTDSMRSDWFQYLTLARVWDQFKYFKRAFGLFPEGLVNLLHPFAWGMVLNFFILFLSLAGLPRVPRSFRPLLLLGPLIFVQSVLASGGATFGVEPIARYLAVAVPAFIVLAVWATREWSEGPRAALLCTFMVMQSAWALYFGMNEWSG